MVFTSDGVGVVVGVVRDALYDLIKIENLSRQRSHKLNGIGVGRIRTFPFVPIPFTYDPVKTTGAFHYAKLTGQRSVGIPEENGTTL